MLKGIGRGGVEVKMDPFLLESGRWGRGGGEERLKIDSLRKLHFLGMGGIGWGCAITLDPPLIP